MGARSMWDRMLVYFGIVDDDMDDVPRVQAGHDDGRQRESRAGAAQQAPAPRRRAPQARTPDIQRGPAGVGIVPPRTFNDAQKVADALKQGMPVIVNLQQTDGDLSKRLIDFASGLTYGLDGQMQRIADRVFLLTPADVEVSAEERAALAEGGFFNQS